MTTTDDSAAKPPRRPFADLAGRYGKRSLIFLAVIVVAGFGLRAEKVFNPLAEPGDDALAYRALAESLYEEGTYGGDDFRDASDWSPGAPLIFAASHYVTGGVNDGVARGIQALLGTAAIVIVFLLAFRLTGGGPAPLIAAALVALYPSFIYSTGALMSEPAAIFTLPAAVLAFLWAADRRSGAAWLAPGLLFGLTALIRPEYMFVGLAMLVLVAIRQWLARGMLPALTATALFLVAALVPIVPWTIHNLNTLDRFVPITTGSGKALFVGTNLPAGGEYQQVKAGLLEQYRGVSLEAGSSELDRIDPVPLFDRAAERYPELSRDAALGRIGKENMWKYLSEDPIGYLGMIFEKGFRMWSSGVGDVMSSTAGRVMQLVLVLLGLAGAILLGRSRRWEVLPMIVPIAVVTGIAVVTLAPPRRNEILMTLVLTLAAIAIATLLERLGAKKEVPTPEGPPVGSTVS
jgi:4-amino-4-deoxy-L-arabinose transferase-like glycosyltransferase